MECRSLGRTGLKVSALSFGALTFSHQDDATAKACLAAAYDAGINFFDNAESYGDGEAELRMGRAMAALGWSRDSYLVSTKLFWWGDGPLQHGLSRKRIVEGTEGSLRRLGLDYIDILSCHRPDPETPIAETVLAMNHVIQQGKALYWGTSEWSAAQIRSAITFARREHLIGPIVEQPQYNVFHRARVECEYAPLCRRGMGVATWSPLDGGILTGKYADGIPPGTRASWSGLRSFYEGPSGQSRIRRARALEPIARELGVTLAQLAIAWCLRHPHVSTVITGASAPAQIEQNLGALRLVSRFDPGVLRRIEDVLENKPRPLIWRFAPRESEE